MTEPMNDDEMLTLLAEALGGDQAPSDALEVAYLAYGWRTLDADLAKLIDDSQVEVVGFHRGAYSRLLSYESTHGTIEVGLDDDAFEIVVAPRPERITLCQPTSTTELTIDNEGRATGSGWSGPVRFEVTWTEGSVQTPWTTL